jgi:hypothetical protein
VGPHRDHRVKASYEQPTGEVNASSTGSPTRTDGQQPQQASPGSARCPGQRTVETADALCAEHPGRTPLLGKRLDGVFLRSW